ncbi:MAG TPA: methionine--tRNA ligase, partial [Candidatus Moranbacteria bacterium]|nr:methionine--tRNA ligase [Candidatus Moranbacteria bacterium]
YITTPIYYANAYPHIGHAYTSVAADVLARWNRQQGKEVFLLTGTDEHGLKIQKKAQELNKNPKEFVDEMADKFESLGQKLNISYGNFIRTTDEKHTRAVQKVLQFFYDQGVIYKGTYEGLYCVGCEQFKNESDLVNGKCPEHNIKPEKIKEESYLLKMEKIQPALIEKIKNNQFKINPLKRRHEILTFLEKNKLKDISISRKNVSWGIPLPFDKKYTAYVWIDAFLNYLTGIGW